MESMECDNSSDIEHDITNANIDDTFEAIETPENEDSQNESLTIQVCWEIIYRYFCR